MTALVIVSEMTGNRDLTLPLMAVTLLGRGASALICRESLYQALAVAFIETARGLELSAGTPPGVKPPGPTESS